MYPWLWLWAPHVEFPLSGNVTQDIEPVANLFTTSNDPEAGNPKIEQKAFEISSYGQQLGLITEVLVEIAEQSLPGAGKNNESLQRLRRIQAAIQTIKDIEYEAELNEIERKVRTIHRRGGNKSKALARKLENLQLKSDA